jgi:hypothetical protein
MLNVNKLALTAARRVVLRYKNSNKRLFCEYKEALNKLKTVTGGDCVYKFSFERDKDLVAVFKDPEGCDVYVTFFDYTQVSVAMAFIKTCQLAIEINTLCFY